MPATIFVRDVEKETIAGTTLIEDEAISNSTTAKIFAKSLGVAAFSAATAEFITFPIDTTKVQLQLMRKMHNLHQKNINNNNNINFSKKVEKISFSHYYKTIYGIYLKSGIKGFYCGYKPALLRASLNNALSTTFYKHIRSNVFNCNTRDCPFYVKCCSGFITGATTQILAAPTDLLKVRMQADSMFLVPRYNGLLDAIIKIYNKHGLLAFYRGLWPSIARAGFSVAATLGTYDHCKAYVLRVMKWQDNMKTYMASSALSGFIATIVSCPFDVVKTKYQSQSITNPLYKSPRHCFSTITKQEGISVLYRSFTPMYLRLAPWQLFFFITFEFLSKHIIGESF